MRQWRVGTYSMGLTMIFFGVLIFISMWIGMAAFDALIAWWPTVFVILGVEILVYLYRSKEAQPVIKYDVFSVIFVGFIGSCCLALTVFASTGVITEIRYALSGIEVTESLPDVQSEIPSQVQNIIIKNLYPGTSIQKATEREIHYFGYVRKVVPSTSDEQKGVADGLPKEMLDTHTIGNTMYVSIKPLPERRNIFGDRSQLSATLVVPKQLNVIVENQ